VPPGRAVEEGAPLPPSSGPSGGRGNVGDRTGPPKNWGPKIPPFVHRFLSFIKRNGRGEKRISFFLFIGVVGYYSGAPVRAHVNSNGGRERNGGVC
jgi:hypothetical protein